MGYSVNENPKWVGKGKEEFCSDPKLLNSKLYPMPEDIIVDITLILSIDSNIRIEGYKKEYFKPVYHRRQGRCFTIQANEIVKNDTIATMLIKIKTRSVKVFVHSPNQKISFASPLEADVHVVERVGKRRILKVQYEVYDLLTYGGKRYLIYCICRFLRTI